MKASINLIALLLLLCLSSTSCDPVRVLVINNQTKAPVTLSSTNLDQWATSSTDTVQYDVTPQNDLLFYFGLGKWTKKEQKELTGMIYNVHIRDTTTQHAVPVNTSILSLSIKHKSIFNNLLTVQIRKK